MTTDRRILLVSVLKQSVWPSSTVPSQRTADGLMTDRRILLILKQSVGPLRPPYLEGCLSLGNGGKKRSTIHHDVDVVHR
jgi:hypothetical protein